MRVVRFVCGALALAISMVLPLNAGPVINEFLASNHSIYPDNSDFDDYSDWIELHNPDSTNVSLSGYFLTDDLTQPFKWLIPGGAAIPANGYLTFRADGFDAAPGETHVRGYYPWGSTFQTRWYHTNFKLSAAGEELGLYRTELPPQDITLISLGAVWKYRDLGTDPGTNWMTAAYDDSTWASGPAELGYGDGDEATVVSYGPNSGNKYPTTYFRIHFNVSDPSRLGNIRFTAKVDDGAIFYLNGVEVARVRMPEGVVHYNDYTPLGGSEYGFERIELADFPLAAGDNVLAVEVHQAGPTSSDISLDAQLLASEIIGDPILVDSVTFGPQTTDVSYGRDPASTNGWSFFGEPTPGAANTMTPLTELSYAPEVSASLDSGFYSGGQSVALSSGAGTTIRYTLDGSVPTSASLLYSTNLAFSATTILRARAFVPGLIPGPILTRSYFVDEDSVQSVPVVSFVADPATLFDNAIGIYSNGTPYPYKGREIPVRLEFFETKDTGGFAVNAGARIGGENIWTKAQKPFNIYMRSKYGDDLINYQVFPGQPVGTFGEIELRNGGDDWAGTLLRDGMMPSILQGQAHMGLYSYRPSVMFLNGQFWGIYNIRKRFDPVYFANEHHLAAGDYDLVQYAHNESGVTVLTAYTGNTESYEAFKEFFTTNNVADTDVYSAVEDRMDIDSFIDYVVFTDFAMNTSWPWNREFWSGRAPGSKWQWNANDFDRGFNPANLSGTLIDDFKSGYPLFQALEKNTNFVNRLLQRYAAHVGSTLLAQRISDILDRLSAEQDPVMQRHIDRWSSSGGIQSLSSRNSQLSQIKQFGASRPTYALNNLQSQLGVNRGLASLTVNIGPAAGGRVSIAGVPMTPEYSSTLNLFQNTPVELTAEPAPGYSFSGWSNGSTNPTIEITLTGAQTVTANFQVGAETVLPGSIITDTTLSASGSPYAATNDLIVQSNVTLTIDPGVQLLMPPGASIYVHGAMQVNGTSNAPVQMLARDGDSWGNLCFVNATGPSSLSHLTIRNAETSSQDPLNLLGAVAAYKSTITLDGADIETLLPVTARFGSTTIRNSRIHALFTGDCINVKNGAALIENNTLIGDSAPDTDGIDFDNVTNGIVRGNRIYAFNSVNGDAIDLGYSKDIQVISNRIFNVYDKGISVGQGSVVYAWRNLIVDCGMGMGIKDAGSTAHADQNTFARDTVGVAAYVKVEGRGGGTAYITNCIFSRCKDAPIMADALSSVTVNYSLSDTLPLPGLNNLLADPLFTDAANYDFSLTADSPAIDSGDPSHPLDADNSRADMGAYYRYDPADYPYLVPNIVVVNEVMAHSHGGAPDWIELHNNSAGDLDIGGWYLSDDPSVPEKYRIAGGTILPGDGYMVFDESTNFGAGSADPGALIPFALSENGESVNIFGPSDGLRPDYTEAETFGASATGVSFGRYYKASTATYNFVAMATPTPGAPNSQPLVGPIVISEIMYHPPVADAEYLELANVSSNPVTLFDTNTDTPWRMTAGVEYDFPTSPPLTMAPGEKILLVHDSANFATNYTVSADAKAFQWTSGSLDNSGETVEISMPGDTNNVGVRQYIRVDHVNYSDSAPWPTGPDGGGTALVRINERAYGNDVANWTESAATPGETGFRNWAREQGLSTGQDGEADDPDGDGIPNAVEYALGTNPLAQSNPGAAFSVRADSGTVSFTLPVLRADVGYKIQKANDLRLADWTDLDSTVSSDGQNAQLIAVDTNRQAQGFFRFVVTLYNQP